MYAAISGSSGMLISLQVATAFLQHLLIDGGGRAGGLREKAAEEGADAGDDRVAGLRISLLRLLALWRRRFKRFRHGGRRRIFYKCRSICDSSLKDQRGANAHAADKNNELRIEVVALHFGGCVVGQRRHEDLIDGAIFCGGLWRGGGSFCSFRVGFLHFFGSWETADFGLLGRWLQSFRDLQFAGAVRDAAAQCFELTVGDKDFACLGYDDTLRRELLFHAHRTTVGANAHGAGLIETDEHILGCVTNGEGLCLDLRGVDGKGRLPLEAGVNDTGVEREGEQVDGFQNGEMCWSADSDLAAFDKVDARLAGIDMDVAAAAQDGPGPALDNFDV